jgi:hypothetical protein
MVAEPGGSMTSKTIWPSEVGISRSPRSVPFASLRLKLCDLLT